MGWGSAKSVKGKDLGEVKEPKEVKEVEKVKEDKRT